MEWLGRVFGSEVAAAWVQAVGSILGIAVAIYVPWKQRHDAHADAEKDRKLKARSLALRLLPGLLDLQPQIQKAIETARGFNPGSPPLANFVYQLVNAATIGLPAELTAVENEMYLFGDKAGFPLQQFLAFVNQHARELQRAHTAAYGLDDVSVALEIRKQIVESLGQIDTLLQTSIERVRPIHNGEE